MNPMKVRLSTLKNSIRSWACSGLSTIMLRYGRRHSRWSSGSFPVEQTIEPTQVAGFNQFFDGITGTVSKNYGVGLDRSVHRTTAGRVDRYQTRSRSAFWERWTCPNFMRSSRTRKITITPICTGCLTAGGRSARQDCTKPSRLRKACWANCLFPGLITCERFLYPWISSISTLPVFLLEWASFMSISAFSFLIHNPSARRRCPWKAMILPW